MDVTCLQEAVEIADLMRAFMEERGGVGIAAPQIGIGLKIMIIASKPNQRYPDAPLMEPLTLINPEPMAYSEATVELWEGCLSVPGLRGKVTRPDGVDIRYVGIDGHIKALSLTGFPARIFLHEYDHLIGKTFVDRVDTVNDLVTDKVYLQQIVQS